MITPNTKTRRRESKREAKINRWQVALSDKDWQVNAYKLAHLGVSYYILTVNPNVACPLSMVSKNPFLALGDGID
jgi:hypothetical protein